MVETAYVFIHLPGQTRATIAGRFEVDPDPELPVGEFVYGQSYLANPSAVPLDPIALPLKEELFRTTLSSGFLGVFRDAIPDDWGRHVASKLYGARFKTLFDYLSGSPPETVWALSHLAIHPGHQRRRNRPSGGRRLRRRCIWRRSTSWMKIHR